VAGVTGVSSWAGVLGVVLLLLFGYTSLPAELNTLYFVLPTASQARLAFSKILYAPIWLLGLSQDVRTR
jgi:hypothetical protein